MLFLCGKKWHGLLCDYQSVMGWVWYVKMVSWTTSVLSMHFYLVPRGIKRDLGIELDQVLGLKLNLWWRSSGLSGCMEVVFSPDWAEGISWAFCSGHYYCCLLKPEPTEVPSYGHQICWGLQCVLNQITLFCLNTSSSFIWMWWKLSRRERTGTVKAAAPPHVPHTDFLWGWGTFWELWWLPYFHFPFQAMHAGCTRVPKV